ncbi:MAG: copper homeostasis protein CutC [Planctomycetota bacterium]
MAIAELLCTDLTSVETALAAGADRLEICAALEVGGVTPGIAFLTAAVRLAEAQGSVEVVALVRPRRGDFTLDTRGGLDLLADEIRRAMGAGAGGVAAGVLTESYEVDQSALEVMLRAATPGTLTFHRAIDQVPHYARGVATLVRAGVTRVLTSGGAASALEGAPAIRELSDLYGGRLELIAAGGVKGSNAARVLELCAPAAIHGSCSTLLDSESNTGDISGGSSPVSMGRFAGWLPETARTAMDPASAHAFVKAAHSARGLEVKE